MQGYSVSCIRVIFFLLDWNHNLLFEKEPKPILIKSANAIRMNMLTFLIKIGFEKTLAVSGSLETSHLFVEFIFHKQIDDMA